MNYILTATREYAGHFQSVNIRLNNGTGDMFPTMRTWALLLADFDYNYGGETITGGKYKSVNYITRESDLNFSEGITGNATVAIKWSEESSVNQDSPRSTIIKVEDITYNNFVSKVLEKFQAVTGKAFSQNKKFYIACLGIRLKAEN